MELLTNPYSFDAVTITRDKHDRAMVKAKIMKVGRLEYVTPDGKKYYGDITLDTLNKAKATAGIKPVTIRHPPSLLNSDDIKLYQEGVSADNAKIEEIDGETWLTNDLILQTTASQKVVENGKLGVSAGYLRDAIPKHGNILNFENIDINHIAIGCANPRAEGAELYSLDEADEDGRLITFAQTAKPIKEVKMAKRILNAVSVGAFSLDEAQIEHGDETPTVLAVETFISREKKLVNEISKLTESLDSKESDKDQKIGDLSGQLKVVEAQKKELEAQLETTISMDELDKHVEELATVREIAKKYGVDAKFSTPKEGKKLTLEKAYPGQSFDDGEIEGAFKTIEKNPKMADEQRKSDQALKKFSLDSASKKVPLWMLEASTVKKLAKRR